MSEQFLVDLPCCTSRRRPRLPARSMSPGCHFLSSQGQRATLLPDVPTVAEQGYADYDISAWVALLAPKGTPAEVIATLNKTVNTALADENLRSQLAKVGAEPGGGTPEELASFMKKDAEV